MAPEGNAARGSWAAKPTGVRLGEAKVLRRFLRHVTFEPTTGCWLWTGAVFGKQAGTAYGCFRVGGAGSRIVSAHRVAYELYVGRIPDALHIDHRCCNPLCVNPGHLQPVTPERNAQLAIERRGPRSLCEAGLHPWVPENLCGRKGGITCKACHRLAMRRYYRSPNGRRALARRRARRLQGVGAGGAP